MNLSLKQAKLPFDNKLGSIQNQADPKGEAKVLHMEVVGGGQVQHAQDKMVVGQCQHGKTGSLLSKQLQMCLLLPPPLLLIPWQPRKMVMEDSAPLFRTPLLIYCRKVHNNSCYPMLNRAPVT